MRRPPLSPVSSPLRSLPSARSLLLPLLLGLALVGGLAACSDGGGGGGGGPTEPQDVLTLTAEPDVVQPFGASRLRATARTSNGTPIVDSALTLSTNLGNLDEESLRTDADGIAETVLRGDGTVGTATVQGQLASGRTASVQVQIGGAGRALEIRATPERIPTDGVATLTLRAFEADGAVIPNAAVALSTNRGRLQPQRVITDASGTGSAELRAEGASGTATVEATLEQDGTEASVEVVFSDNLRLTLTASPDRIATNGESAVAVAVARADGSPVGAGTRVDLETNRGRLRDPAPRTNTQGIAQSVLEAGGAIGVATLEASADGATPESIEVVFGADLRLTVTASPSSLPAGGSSTIEAAVSRTTGGGTVGAGIEVEFVASRGSLSSRTDRTNGAGIATTILRTSTNDTGTVVITARLPDLGVEGAVAVILQ